jgi:hypothetical protein
MAAEYGTTLVMRTRAAWVNDDWSKRNTSAMFEELPGSIFTMTGALPPCSAALASVEAEVRFKGGFSVALRFDGNSPARLRNMLAPRCCVTYDESLPDGANGK